ncbi:MAG: tRNA pseudouridine(38-40) synthase TruA [Sulfurovum sp.]|nr:MAG: tRNA pseudouridine(38-40) synthase TruA [Sulfurovum sp.]
MRIKAVIAYDGSVFEGFQRQKRTPRTVTQTIEDALRSLQINTQITGSGRTDAGVHATGQVIHFDLPPYWQNLQKLQHELNRKLSTIYFKHLIVAPDDFHARFDATKRIYRYIFKTHPPLVFERNYVSYYKNFDPSLLAKTLSFFEGVHDFVFFHKTGADPHTTMREIYRADYKKIGHYHLIYFQADGFLRAQVRLMIETAMQCAQGELHIEQLKEQLAGEKRHNTKPAPTNGLYLARIIYNSMIK